MKSEIQAEPFRIKMVEPIRQTTREKRARVIAEAGYNVSNLKAEGGFIAVNDPDLYQQAAQWAIVYEGFPTPGSREGGVWA